jgi:hypothetical protein
MWLHYRDMNVSGQPRCPGDYAADDARLALSSETPAIVSSPMTGPTLANEESRAYGSDWRKFRSSDFSSYTTVD